MKYHTISTFDLPIGPRVGYGSPVHPNVVIVTKTEKFLPSKLSAIVSDDAIRDAEAMDNVKEERDGLVRLDVSDRLGLYPLGEFVHRNEQVTESTRCLS